METLEILARQINTTQDLQSIVRTMKALSAVSIRQYEKAVESLHDHGRAIELGLRAILSRQRAPEPELAGPDGVTVAVVFGSDHGLCGRFNRQIADFARKELRRREIGPHDTVFLVAGSQAAAELVAAGERIAQPFLLPGSVVGLPEMAESVLLAVEEWRERTRVARVLIFNNVRLDVATASPRMGQLLPLDDRWLRDLAGGRWPSRARPVFSMESTALFAAVVRQYLFIALFEAGAESAASEHATRLMAMEAAERNIDERLTEMSGDFRRLRQESITEELLDVVAGFEALEVSGDSAS